MKLRPRGRRLRRSELARRRRFVLGTIVAVILIAVSAWRLSMPPLVKPTALARPAAVSAPAVDTEPVTSAEALAAPRPNYPFSVIRGGAPTPDTLRQAAVSDAVVRTHYSNFDLANVQVVRLREARTAHVSYRMGNAVYWTRSPVRLNAGELLLTDGVHYARTRCGNQIADVAGATRDDEPSAAILDEPLPPIRPFGLAGYFATFPLTAGVAPELAFARSSAGGIELLLSDADGVGLLMGSAAGTRKPNPSTARESESADPAGLLSGRFDEPSPVGQLAAVLEIDPDTPGTGRSESTIPGTESDPLEPVTLPVPEPATMLLIGTGLAAAALRGWKGRRGG